MIDHSNIVKVLQADSSTLFVVIDAAHSPIIVKWLQASTLPHETLFSGVRAITLAQCAPYLVQLDRSEVLLTALVEALWGSNSLFFLNSDMNMADVRLELKKKLRVSLPGGTQGLFRFYDPRVWRRIMQHGNHEQRMGCFTRGIHRYVTEIEGGEHALELTLRERHSLLVRMFMEPTLEVVRHELRSQHQPQGACVTAQRRATAYVRT